MNEQKLVAYHGKKEIKEKYVARVLAHQKADEIVQGVYWRNGKGCCIGCAAEMNEGAHEFLQKELDFPLPLLRLADRIFEGLTNSEAKFFPAKFFQSVETKADLSLVIPKFLAWLMLDPENGVIRFAAKDEKVKAAILQVGRLHEKEASGEKVDETIWSAARSAARSAAESAARSAGSAAWSAAWSAAESAAGSAAWSAAESAAGSAAESAARSAWSAAESAARSAWSAARSAGSAAYLAMAQKLLQLLKEAPVSKETML